MAEKKDDKRTSAIGGVVLGTPRLPCSQHPLSTATLYRVI